MNFCYPCFPPRKAENILMSVFSISFLSALLLSFDICFIIWLQIVSLCFIFHSIFLHYSFLPGFSSALYFAVHGDWNARPILSD